MTIDDAHAQASLGTPSHERTFGQQLSHQIWTTKGARFNAHRRLTRKNDWSQRALACLSIYVTTLTLAAAIPAFHVSADAQTKISVTAGALALAMVVFSLTEGGRNYLGRADKLHTCAMALGALYTKVQAAMERTREPITPELETLAEEYHRILSGYEVNHEECDFQLFKATNPAEFKMGAIKAFQIRVFAAPRNVGFEVLAVIGPPLLAAIFLLRR